MSLQLAAQHMASRGRGPDTQLVHMAPQEVAGLQALAKAHGGSLTTNPDTGLPEAGFLSSILPMVAGAFLGPAGLGLTAMQSGLAAGALGTLATGSLKKGLMAGLGAYGGAGLAGGVVNAGTGALSSAAGNAAANSVVPAVATEAAPALIQNTAPALSSAANVGTAPAYNALTGGFNAVDPGLGVNFVSPVNAAEIVPTVTQAPALSQQAADIGNAYAQEQAAQNAVANKLATTSPFETAKSGLGEIIKDPKRFLTKDNLMYAGAAAAPFLFQEPEQKARKEEKPYEYSFNYNRSANPNAGYAGPYTGERTYFNPTFTRTAAGGGLMDLGPVEAMSNRNEAETLMANGGQMFAEGGETKAVAPVEDNPFYTMTGQSGDAFKYLMGQGPKVAAAPAAASAVPAVVATPVSLANSIGLDNSYAFNPSTGTFASIGATAANTSPAAAVQYYLGGSDSANTGVTPQQAAVFDFMNTPAGQSYKDAFGAANSRAIGSLMPGSIFTGALKGQFDNPFAALRDANNVFTAAGEAARAGRIGNLSTGYEGVGGSNTYSPTGVSGIGVGSSEGINSMDAMSDAATGGGFSDVGGMGAAAAADAAAEGYMAQGGLAALAGGGQSHLGDYSDGGRLLRGPGDGVSDSIPASIGDKRPARLADGEFVVPARIVSELGNGSTEAGARKLYAMMDRVQKARGKTVGKGRVAVNSRAEKMLPA